MSEPGDRVAVPCPACSPEIAMEHEVLSGGHTATVRCRECMHVHTATVEDSTGSRTVRTVVSQDGDSLTSSIEVPDDAVFEVGQEFIVETDEAVYSVELTSIEGESGQRHDRLDVHETATLWTRDIGNVAIDVTIHPPSGSDASSRSTTLHTPGSRTFEVGEQLDIDGEPGRIHGIHLRDDDVDRRKLNRTGDTARAKDIDRLYVRSTRRVRRSAW